MKEEQRPKRNPEEDHAYDVAYRVTIVDRDEGIILGGSKAKVMLQRGIYMGEELTYIAKRCVSARKARAELRVYSTLLHPLQGFYVSTIIGITDICEDSMTFAMSMPHVIRWKSAHFPLSDETKDKIVEALRLIHSRGVLHGDIAFRHILIDDSETVTIVDFSNARTIEDHADVDLDRCTKEEQELEMRKLKYLIGYGSAREIERKAASASQDTASREHSAKNPVFGLAELDALDRSSAMEYPRIELPPDKRNYHLPTLASSARRGSTEILNVQVDEDEHKGRRYGDRRTAVFDVPIDVDENPYIRYHPKPLGRCQDPAAAALAATQYQTPSYRRLTSLLTPISRHNPPALQDFITGESMWEALYVSVESRLPTPRPVQQSSLVCAFSPGYSSSDTLGIPDTRPSTSLTSPGTESAVDSSTPPNLNDKRSFQVAFTPETEVNSLWSTGSMTKRRRPATPFMDAEQIVEGLPDTLCYLSAITPSTVDAFEAPPHRDASISPAPQSPNGATAIDVQEDDESGAVYIVITSPIGHRRVWGVPETVAAEVSRLLDRKQDERIPEFARAYELAHATAAIKRKLEEEAQENSEAKLKIAKRNRTDFSRESLDR